MTEIYPERVVVRLASQSFVVEAKELEPVVTRIKKHIPDNPPMAIGEPGIEIEIRHTPSGERIVNHRLVNREGRGELFLDLNPADANCPSSSSSKQ